MTLLARFESCFSNSARLRSIFGLAAFSALLFWTLDRATAEVPLGLKPVPVPAGNPQTPEKIALGKQLYFEPRLSKDNTVSCASCHHPEKGFSNDARFATGVGGAMGGRSAPSVINAAYYQQQFWDGRAASLEEQALGPIANPIEMALSIEDAIKRLNSIDGYKSQFQKVFGTDATPDAVAKAIASYERTVLCGNAPFDRFKAGDKSALSEAAERGRKLFFGKANCAACNGGGNFSDGGYHNIGIGMDAKEPDLGRFAVTKLGGDKGSLKTPTLREIARTATYMHDGSLKTLEEVVEWYVKGGHPNDHLSKNIRRLELSDQYKADLVAFMKACTGEFPRVEQGRLPQ